MVYTSIVPVGGLAFFTTAPADIEQVLLNPLRAAAYLGTCGFLRCFLADLA